MSIYTPWETTQELYGETPIGLSTGEPVWWDEDGGPWTDYIFDSSDEEEDEEDLFPSDTEDSDTEDSDTYDSDSEFDPGSDEEQDQELMECSCCGNIWDGKAQCYCMCYGCEKCETSTDQKETDDEEWDEESLVRETYGRRTYNFGDTKLGPIYVPSEEEANEEHTTMNYF
tara:strand:+ start:60 stop:572 length:513 start_codon:yes stop_codon:yes gene_type:complete